MTWPEWIEHLGQFTLAKLMGWAFGITAIFLGLRKVWPWLKAFVRMVDTIAELPDRLDVIEKSQESTAKELTDNHGSSLKDATKRMEAAVARLQSDLEAHIEFCKQREYLLAGKKPEKDK